MDTINFSDFEKLDVRIGKILKAEKAKGSDKLMKMRVDFGTEKRQIIGGIAGFYKPEEIIGKECPFLFNLKTKSFRGEESQGMLLAVDVKGDRSDCILLHPNREVKPGAKVV